jgi:hypothetical protein
VTFYSDLGASEMSWSPISSTIICRQREAVLADTPIAVDQNDQLAAWIAASGKNLAAIYATRMLAIYPDRVNPAVYGFLHRPWSLKSETPCRPAGQTFPRSKSVQLDMSDDIS